MLFDPTARSNGPLFLRRDARRSGTFGALYNGGDGFAGDGRRPQAVASIGELALMIRHFFLPISSWSPTNSTSEEERPSVSTAFQGEPDRK